MRSLLASLAPSLSSAVLAVAVAGGLAAGCTAGDPSPPAPAAAIARAVPMAPSGQQPRLFAGGGDRVAAATSAEAAIAYVARLAPGWGAPTGTAALTPIATVRGHLGDLVRLQQTVDGVAVHRRELRVLVRPDGSLGAASGVAVPADIDRRGRFALAPATAVTRAVAATHGVGPDPTTLVARASATSADEVWFHSAPGAVPYVGEARAQKRWHAVGDHLEAAWVIEAYSAPDADGTDTLAFRTVVAADSGEVLDQVNLTADAFGYRVWAAPDGDRRPLDGPTADFTPHPTGLPGGARPAFIPPALVSVDGLNHPAGGGPADPWLPAGATETRGNHVDAYTDINNPDGFGGADFRATTTAPGQFDRVYDPTRSPLASNAQQMAAITSLFYTMNWLHDDWYDAGFDEAAGNGQDDNYGRGGVGGDELRAEAQDRANDGARNNANMSTPSDGMSPRMQVFLWTGADHVNLTIQPGGRTPTVAGGAFDPRTYDVSGAVIAGADATAPVTDACQAITTNVTGKIVLADRGNCTFKRKALNVQQAGGIGAIIANSAAGGLPSMGNDTAITTPITIPVIGVTLDDGNQLRTALAAGPVTVRMQRQSDPDNDGSLDGGLVAHEYGHYLHHRMSDCNTKLCSAMSEGWADFFALHLMARPGDDLNGTFAMSTYAESGDPYFGIRRAPYSVNMDKNAFTLKHVADGAPLPNRHPVLNFGVNSEVHNAGEIWAGMLWEAYVALQRAHGDFAASRRLMAEYVVDGLLMAPTDATITETRDAILLAAFMNAPEDHDTLAAAFARRGAGSCAISPGRESVDFTDVSESFELKPNSYATTPILTIDVHDCDGDGVLDVGETATVRTTVGNNGAAGLADVTVALTSTTPGVEVKTAPIVIPGIAHYASMPVAFEVALTAGTMPLAGDLTVTVTAAGACSPTLTLASPVRMNVDDQPSASTTDTFDAQPGAWSPTGAGADMIWANQRETALDGQWVGVDFGGPSETALESPPMVAGSGPITVEFDHAFDFELTDGTLWDGGVIEMSTDGGATWADVGGQATPAYTGVITDQSGNPLAGRMAYSGQNVGFPAKEHVTLSLGTMAGQTFQLRFLIGTDQAVGAGGWRLDDLKVSGLTNKPFPTQVDDAGTCNPDAPGPDDGGCCQTGGGRGGELVAGLLVIGGLLLRRRRR